MEADVYSLTFESGRAVIGGENITKRIRSEKWSLFLALLAQQAQSHGGFFTYEALSRHPKFTEKKPENVTEDEPRKPLELVKREIGNFIRNTRKDGFDIFVFESIENGGWAIDSIKCDVPDIKTANPVLLKHLGTPQEELFDFDETETVFAAWLAHMINGKLNFWKGNIKLSLRCFSAADKLASSNFLKAATFAELARVVYRAESDSEIDWRERTIEFLDNVDLLPILRTIYSPRIYASYQFSRDSGLDTHERVEAIERISADFVQGVDISGLCRALNISFITYQAAGNQETQSGKSKGLLATRAASVFSLSVGDPDLIQASIFNYVLALRHFGNSDQTVKVQTDLLVFNYKFCAALGIGDDSAQGSLLLADVFLENENSRSAKIALLRAAKIIRKTNSMLDRALFYSLAGTYAIVKGGTDSKLRVGKVKIRYRKAIEYYEGVGRSDAADSVKLRLAFVE